MTILLEFIAQYNLEEAVQGFIFLSAAGWIALLTEG